MADNILIEVAFATPEKQRIVALEVPVGTSVFDGACLSSIKDDFPEIDFDTIGMGIFGKVVKKPRDEVLRAGDRIELYRPLLIDPKQARLNRAAKKS